jgi:hypothetical protein
MNDYDTSRNEIGSWAIGQIMQLKARCKPDEHVVLINRIPVIRKRRRGIVRSISKILGKVRR